MNPIDAEKFERALTRAPKHTQDKIAGLIDRSAAAAAALSTANDLQREEWQTFILAEGGFLAGNEIDKAPTPFGTEPEYTKGARFKKANDDWFIRERERVIGRWRAWRRKQDAVERAQAEWEHWAFLSDTRTWLQDEGRSHSLVGLVVPAPKLGRGQTFESSVAAIRQRIDEIADETYAAEHAPRTAEELIAAMSDHVDGIARAGEVQMYPSNRRASPFDLNGASVRSGEHVAIGVTGETIVWLLADDIKAKLAERIRAASEGGMSDDDQQATLARLAAEKLTLERQEEALIVAADESGTTIARRREADPRAILEIVE